MQNTWRQTVKDGGATAIIAGSGFSVSALLAMVNAYAGAGIALLTLIFLIIRIGRTLDDWRHERQQRRSQSDF